MFFVMLQKKIKALCYKQNHLCSMPVPKLNSFGTGVLKLLCCKPEVYGITAMNNKAAITAPIIGPTTGTQE